MNSNFVAADGSMCCHLRWFVRHGLCQDIAAKFDVKFHTFKHLTGFRSSLQEILSTGDDFGLMTSG